MEAVQWMAAQAPEPPCLQSCSLGQLVEDLLAEHFFTPVLQDLHIRRLHGKLHQVIIITFITIIIGALSATFNLSSC